MRTESLRRLSHMNLSQFAENYCRSHNYRRTPIHSANRFTKLSKVTSAESVTVESIEAFRQAATASKLSIWTIEKTVTDVLTLVREATGRKLEPGKRMRRPRPRPKPGDLEAISAMVLRAPEWLSQLVAIAYWTGLRISDGIALQCNLSASAFSGETLYWTASKTGKIHSWPVPEWLANRLKSTKLPYHRANCNAGKRVREGMWAACDMADVPTLTPKQIRQRSLTEWASANGAAGAIIHGTSNLRVLTHYVDPLRILQSAAPRVRLPACFRADSNQDKESAMLGHFRRLDPDAQLLIACTAERLAAG